MLTMLRGVLVISTGLCLAAVSAQSDDRTANVVQGVSYIGMSVSDIGRSANYYSGAAGLDLGLDDEIESNVALDLIAGREGVSAESRLLKGANAQLRLLRFKNPSAEAQASSHVEVHGPGIAHICFQVNRTTGTYQRFLEAGALPIGDHELQPLNPRNPVEYGYIRDADGIIAEVEHVDFEQLSTARNNDYRVRHISLATPDIEQLVAFYSILMEEPEPRRLSGLAGENFDKVSGYTGAELEMAWFQVRNLELELVQYVSHPTQAPAKPRPLDALGYNMIVFDVVSLEAAREKLIMAGGLVVSEPAPMDDGEMFFGRDTDGNLLGFQVISEESAYSSRNFSDNGT